MNGKELGELMDRQVGVVSHYVGTFGLGIIAAELERLTVARIESAAQIAEQAGYLRGLGDAMVTVDRLISEKRKEFGV